MTRACVCTDDENTQRFEEILLLAAAYTAQLKVNNIRCNGETEFFELEADLAMQFLEKTQNEGDYVDIFRREIDINDNKQVSALGSCEVTWNSHERY
eukprot:8652294-Pyramimonas_sp.AAC.1